MTADSEHWIFYFDPNRCIGCHACSISCKQFHGRGSDTDDWRTVTHHQTGSYPSVQDVPISMSCMHCYDAPCEEVCPTNAIEKRESDGIVTIDRNDCIGCKYCGWACPFGAPTYGDEGLMSKCNMCLGQGPGGGADVEDTPKHELDDQVDPNCVSECVGEAIKAGPQEEIIQEASEAAAERYKGGTSAKSRVITEPLEESTSESVGDVAMPEKPSSSANGD